MAAESALAHKPAALTFAQASTIPQAGAIALQGTDGAAAGRRVLINGAGGGSGSFAIQLAKRLGGHVTGVDNAAKLEFMRSLGADEVIDYTREDLVKRGPVFDVVIDAVGKYAWHWGRRALKPGGIYVETDFGPHKLETLVMWPLSRWIGSRRLKVANGRRSKTDVQFMKKLIEAGAYRPVVDRTYPMEQVAEAHRHVEGWHKVGNVVLTL